MDQLFIEANRIEVQFSNKNKNKTLYWEASVGLQEFNHNKLRGLLFPTGQQKKLHHKMENYSDRDFVESQESNEEAIFMEVGLGTQILSILSKNQKTELIIDLESEAFLSSLSKLNSYSVQSDIKLSQKLSTSKAYMGGKTQKNIHKNQSITFFEFYIGLLRKKYSLELGVGKKVAGDNPEYLNYANEDDDLIYRGRLQYFFKN